MQINRSNVFEVIATGVVLLAIFFGAGRYSAPTKVETKTVTQTVYQDRVVEKRVEVQAEAKERIVYRDRTVVSHPDGTVEHRDIVRTDDSDKTKDTDAVTQLAEHTTEVTKAAEKIVERVAPSWQVNALGGMTWGSWKPVYGAQVQRRILGPLWIGAWGLSSGEGGISAGVQF